MGYGILQQGQTVKNQAKSGIRSAAKLEENRNNQNKAIQASEKQAKASNATAGATIGAMAGANMASTAAATAASGGAAATGIAGLGVMGAAAATGGIGLAAGLLLSELF